MDTTKTEFTEKKVKKGTLKTLNYIVTGSHKMCTIWTYLHLDISSYNSLVMNICAPLLSDVFL